MPMSKAEASYDIIWVAAASDGMPMGCPDSGRSGAECHAKAVSESVPGWGPYSVETYLKCSPEGLMVVWTALQQFIDNSIEPIALGESIEGYDEACKLRDILDIVFAEAKV